MAEKTRFQAVLQELLIHAPRLIKAGKFSHLNGLFRRKYVECIVIDDSVNNLIHVASYSSMAPI
jgi:hypothetical protein